MQNCGINNRLLLTFDFGPVSIDRNPEEVSAVLQSLGLEDGSSQSSLWNHVKGHHFVVFRIPEKTDNF